MWFPEGKGTQAKSLSTVVKWQYRSCMYMSRHHIKGTEDRMMDSEVPLKTGNRFSYEHDWVN